MSATNGSNEIYVVPPQGSQREIQQPKPERNDEKDLEPGRKDEPDSAPEPPVATEERYSMWSYHEKLLIITLTGFASMLSAMGATVYYPALPTIADDLGISISQVNLTVTSYLILQGLSPMVFGPMADYRGRRLVYVICLLIACAACTGMALLPRNDSAYPLLIFLRCLQSAGSASTISLGYGTITDIATPAERGFLAGLMSLGPYAGPAIGPVVGGILAGAFGWRGIFWFMAAFSAAIGLAILLFLPETLRAIVHAGEVRPPVHLRPLIPVLVKYRRDESDNGAPAPKPKRLSPGFLKWPDALLMLTCNGVSFAVFPALMASISTVLKPKYPFLTETTVGLCFLPVGVATCLGSIFTGKLIDREFRKAGGTNGEKVPIEFELEKARLGKLPIYVVGAALTMLAYGWTVGRTPLAVPLIFTFLYGFVGLSIYGFIQQILMDLAPGQGASVTAASNLFRCLMSGAIIGAQDPLQKAVGAGGLFTLFAGLITIVVLPLVAIERKYGQRWRRRRAQRAERAAEKQAGEALAEA